MLRTAVKVIYYSNPDGAEHLGGKFSVAFFGKVLKLPELKAGK